MPVPRTGAAIHVGNGLGQHEVRARQLETHTHLSILKHQRQDKEEYGRTITSWLLYSRHHPKGCLSTISDAVLPLLHRS